MAPLQTPEPLPAPPSESVPQKPVLIPLGPIADAVFNPLQDIVEEFANKYPNVADHSIIDAEDLKRRIDGLINTSSLSDPSINAYRKIVLEVVILRALSDIIQTNYGTELDYERLTKLTFVLLDISLYLTAKAKLADVDLPFLVIHKIILKNSKCFILNHFQDHLFSASTRIQILRDQCGVESALQRPGTEVIEIYNTITSIFDLQSEDHVRFIGKMRILISELFEFDDTLFDRPALKINEHFGLERDNFSRLKRGSSSAYALYAECRYYITYPESIFSDRRLSKDKMSSFIELVNVIIDKDLKQKNVRTASTITGGSTSDDIMEHLRSMAAQLQFSSPVLMAEDLFESLFKHSDFRKLMGFQVYIFACHMISHFDNKRLQNLLNIRAEQRQSKDYWLKVKKVLQTHYKSIDQPFFFLMSSISQDCNIFWTEWKQDHFNTPMDFEAKTGRLDKTRGAVSKNCQIRKRHIPQYGTNEISRIWKLETGMKKIKKDENTKEQTFGELREALAKASYVVEMIDEDPEMYTATEIAAAKQKKEMLTFKTLRLYRENGKWLAFSQTNYQLGVEGLFDDSLIIKYKEDRAKQEEARKEKEKALEPDGDKEDVEMTDNPAAAVPVQEDSAAGDDDLDY